MQKTKTWVVRFQTTVEKLNDSFIMAAWPVTINPVTPGRMNDPKPSPDGVATFEIVLRATDANAAGEEVSRFFPGERPQLTFLGTRDEEWLPEWYIPDVHPPFPPPPPPLFKTAGAEVSGASFGDEPPKAVVINALQRLLGDEDVIQRFADVLAYNSGQDRNAVHRVRLVLDVAP